MYNITPIEYLASLPKEIVLNSLDIIANDNRYWIGIANINGTSFDLHEGRKFKIYKTGNNTVASAVTVEYQQRVSKNGVVTKYLIFPNQTYATYKNSTVIAYGTFQIPKENQAITLLDAYTIRPIVGNIDEVGNVLDSGKSGLISGIDLEKLQNKLKTYFLLNDAVPLNNNNTELCRVKLNRGNLNQIRVTCMNNMLSLNLDLKIKYISDTEYINTLTCEFRNEYDANWNQSTIKFSVAIQKYNNGTTIDEWAILSWKSIDYTGTDYKLFVETPNISNTQPKGASVGNTLNLTWNNNDIINNGIFLGSVIEIPITQQLAYIDNQSVRFNIYVGETNTRQIAIKNTQNLNTLLPGNYYYTPAEVTVANLINIPIGLTDSFTVQCIKTGLPDIRATYILITKKGALYYGYMENNTINWATQASLDHYHNAKDITTDADHRFVTDIWVDSINTGLGNITDITKNTLWTATGYDTKADLPSNSLPGTNAIVQSDETNSNQVTNYLYTGNDWIPTSINALKIITLTNNSGLMSSDMLKRLNSVEKQFMLGVGTNWQRLENTQTNHLDGINRAIDFVYRGTVASNYFGVGTDSIAFGNGPIDISATKSFVVGFDVAKISGEYQVALGQGLKYSGALKNITLFGKFNEADDNILFAYGIGDSDEIRKNAFWVSKEGDVPDYFFNTVKGYKIQGKGSDDIVLSDGTTFSKASIPTEQSIMDKVMALFNTTIADQTTDIIQLLDYSGNSYTTLPIIQQRWKNEIKYMVDSWADFKLKVAKLSTPLLGQKIIITGYPTINDGTTYVYCEGGLSDEITNEFTKENENWCILDTTNSTGLVLPSPTDAKSFEGNLFILITDKKIYRFNAGQLNSVGVNTWQYFGMSINFGK